MAGLFGGSSAPIVNETPKIAGLRFQTSCYGGAISVVIGKQRCTGNLIYCGDLQSIKHTQASPGGGGKGGGGITSSSVSYTYRYSMQVGICDHPAEVGEIWMQSGSDKLKLSENPQYGHVIYPGTVPNGYSTVLESRHPDMFFRHPGLCNFTAVDLGEFEGDTPPSFSFEVMGVAYDPDLGGADPALAIDAIIKDAHWGAGAQSEYFPLASDYGDYAVAMGFVIGLEMSEQRRASDWIQEILDQTNARAVWAADHLEIIPLADTEVSGNGRAWAPDLQPEYELTDADFNEGDDPVRSSRPADSEMFNIQPVEFRNRDNEYNIQTEEGDDPADVAMFGPKKSNRTITAHGLGYADIAHLLGSVVVSQVRRAGNQYEFNLPWTFCRLLPMCVVAITCEQEGLYQHPVILNTVVDTADSEIHCTAEDFPASAGVPMLIQRQATDGYNKDFNAVPDNLVPPVFIESERINSTRMGIQIGVALCPTGPNWGGADIYSSLDGETYQLMKRWELRARFGTTLSAVSDAEGQILDVSLAGVGGQIVTASNLAAVGQQTLIVVGMEYCGYTTAELVAENQYSLTLANRGALNTDAEVHAAGSKFVRVDDTIAWSEPLDKNLIGQKVWFKFCSFNQFGGARESLEDAIPYIHVVTGGYARAYPPDVQELTAAVASSNILFGWQACADQDVRDYGYLRMRCTPKLSGVKWGDGLDIGPSFPGTSTSGTLPLMAGTYMAKWVDSAGTESKEFASVSTTAPAVMGMNAVATLDESGWEGECTGVAYNASLGGVVMANKLKISEYPGLVSEWGLLSAVGGIVSAGQYHCHQPVDIGRVATCRVTADIQVGGFRSDDRISSRSLISSWRSVSGLDVSDNTVRLQIRTTDADPVLGEWSAWQDFYMGDWTARAYDFRVLFENPYPENNILLSRLVMTVDAPDRVQSANDITSSATGALRVFFPDAFFAIPAMAITAQDMQTGDFYQITDVQNGYFDIVFKNAANTVVVRTFDYYARSY